MKKKIMSLLLAITMMTTNITIVFAENNTKEAVNNSDSVVLEETEILENEESFELQEEMKEQEVEKQEEAQEELMGDETDIITDSTEIVDDLQEDQDNAEDEPLIIENESINEITNIDKINEETNSLSILESKANFTLPLNTIVNGEILSSNTVNTYTLNITKAGRVKIEYKSFIYDSYIELIDYNGNTIFKKKVYYGDINNPKCEYLIYDLEPGTYCIKVYPYGNNTGKYTLKATHTPANNNDKEPNNGIETAQSISLGTAVTGFISETDSVDYYKVSVPKAGRVKFEFKSYISGVDIAILDKSGNIIDKRRSWDGYEDNPKYETLLYDLEAGTYYFKVQRISSNRTGKYTLKITHTAANNNEKEPNNGIETAQAISLGKTVTGFISYMDSVDYYKVNVPKAGRVKFEFNSYIYGVDIAILDKSGNIINQRRSWDGYEDNPKYETLLYDLEAGIYYFKVKKISSNTGKYTLKVTHTAANNNDKEPNNGIEIAQSLAMAVTTTGFISQTDDLDYYKIKVAKTGTTKFVLNTYIKDTDIEILDSKGNRIYSKRVYKYSDGAEKLQLDLDLSAGTYYIKISQNNYTGKYTLYYEDQSIKTFKNFTVNSVKPTATTVTGKGVAGATVKAYVNGKQIGSSATVDKNGNYKITIPKQKSSTKITVKISKAGYRTASKSINVLKTFSSFTVNSVKYSSTTISGKGLSGATVKAYVDGKQIGKNATVDKNGNYKITIPKQKAGKTIEVKISKSGYVTQSKTTKVLKKISTFTVNTIKTSTTTIKGTGLKGATVKAYIGNKQLGETATVDNNGNYKIKISKQKAGTKIKVKINKKDYETLSKEVTVKK